MSAINWGPVLHFDPHTPLDAFATHGIPLPTYGNYGGPGYSAGELGGTTPTPDQLTDATRPVDSPGQLDWLFYAHDLTYQQSTDPAVRVAADINLVESMAALTYTDPGSPNYDPEAGLYEGFATLAIVGLLAGNGVLQALPEPVQQTLAADTREALTNFEAGLAALPDEGRSLHGVLPVIEAQHPDWFSFG